MIFFFRKFVEALLMPIGLSCLLMILGMILRRRLISVGAVVLLALFSTKFMGLAMLRPLEQAYPPRSVASAPNVDAIVVLSGNIVRGRNAVGLQWGERANRYFTGLNLAQSGKARWIVFTVDEGEGRQGPTQADLMRDAAIGSGVKPDSILLTGSVRTTEDEAREVSKLPGVHSILLVTSALHMSRSVLLFRARGLDVTPFPTDQRAGRHRLSALDFIPLPLGLQACDDAMREYYGLAVYHLIL